VPPDPSSRLVGALPILAREGFLSDHFAQTPFKDSRAGGEDPPLPPLTRREFFQYIATHCRFLVAAHRIALFRNGQSCVLSAEALRRAVSGTPAPEAAFTTIQCFHLHQLDDALRALSLELAAFLGETVGVNAYYSTPAARQGLHTHVDGHDVIVLQCEGERCWQVDRRKSISRAQRQAAIARFADAPDKLVVTLRPGECLYIPRGFAHQTLVSQSGQDSLHLSFGIYRSNGRAVVEWLTETLANDPRLATPLVPSPLDPGAGLAAFRELVGAITGKLAEVTWPTELESYLRAEEASTPLLVESKRPFARRLSESRGSLNDPAADRSDPVPARAAGGSAP
jgi:dTDP-4-dehydrorhamnose 3,5-epimerase-like enzyme